MWPQACAVDHCIILFFQIYFEEIYIYVIIITSYIIIANFTKLSLIKLLFYLYMLVENKKNYINHVMQK